jgi:hypothetical protein
VLSEEIIAVKFQVLMAASMEFKVFWDVAPCSQVDVDYTALHPRRLNFNEIIAAYNENHAVPINTKCTVIDC